MSELSSLFGIISEGQKQAAAEKAERIRIEEERRQRLEPQVEVELNDLSEFFGVMSTKKKIDSLPKETKQEVQQLEVLSSFFEQMSKFETSLDSAIQASEKKPEVVEKIVEVPVEKIVEKEVIVEKIITKEVKDTHLIEELETLKKELTQKNLTIKQQSNKIEEMEDVLEHFKKVTVNRRAKFMTTSNLNDTYIE